MFSPQIIKELKVIETPFYLYDLNLFKKTVAVAKKAASIGNYHIHYAFKANVNDPILNIIRDADLGADCVSGNEILKALECGFDPKKIVFAGVGKTDKEINIGLANDVGCFNCESIPELEVLNQLAANQNKVANIALRINPDVDAKTHKYITTGLEENKFGIYLTSLNDAIAKVHALKNLRLQGLHFHIGSQITDFSVFEKLCIRVNEIYQQLRDQDVHLPVINLGGGLGIDYQNPTEQMIPDFDRYFNTVKTHLKQAPEQAVHFELGRSLVGQSGTLVNRALYVKTGLNVNFVVLDGGMTELIRPALYQAKHQIENLTSSGSKQNYDVVGPICESSDVFGKAIQLPKTQRGDLIAIRSAGAYGQVMQSAYNLRDAAKAIYLEDDAIRLA